MLDVAAPGTGRAGGPFAGRRESAPGAGDPMRVLLVEDDQRLARLIARVLREERFEVDVALDGEAGAALALRGVYDVAVLDWMLPGRDGPAVCRAIRAARLKTTCCSSPAWTRAGCRCGPPPSTCRRCSRTSAGVPPGWRRRAASPWTSPRRRRAASPSGATRRTSGRCC
jgi:hypothetical protein